VSSIIGTLARLGLASVCSLCARVAWAIENSGLSASPEGLACTPLFQQPGILPAPSSPCHALVSPPPRCSGLESPFSMPCPRSLHDARPRRLPWRIDRKGGGNVPMTRRLLDLNRNCLRCHAWIVPKCVISYDAPRRDRTLVRASVRRR
jgi:hypothetical protein